MSILSRLRGLDRSDRRLFFEAMALTAAVRLGLTLLPFTVVRRCLDRVGSRTAEPRMSGRPRHRVHRIVWAVRAAAARIPAATCLVEALAADTLLRRHGHSSSLKIGVRPGRLVPLDAHAWVECGGTPVIGATPQLAEYYRLEQSCSTASQTLPRHSRRRG